MSVNHLSYLLRLCSLLLILGTNIHASAGIIQWRVRVPAGAENPTNLGSFTNTIEIGNGGTTDYNPGLDFPMDTSIVPNNRFFVTYIDQDPEKVEYEFTQELLPGESYTARLSFENNGGGGFAFTQNTVEFLAADGHFTYDLSVDTNDNGSDDTFRSGAVAEVMRNGGELEPWNQLVFLGNDHRNNWHYGTLTITAQETPLTPNADFDSSGTVDGEDLAIWQTGYGATELAARGDGDSDGDFDVDGNDFLNWQRQLGNQALGNLSQSHNAARVVPEPEAMMLLVSAIGLMVVLIHKRGHRNAPNAHVKAL